MNDTVSKIKDLLETAHTCDLAAREHRRKAGLLLAQLRHDRPAGNAWLREVGIDSRSADLLVEMGAGGRAHDAA